jgi:hypothetical protein
MSLSLKRLQNTFPQIFSPESNRVILALLTAIAESDDDVRAAIEEAKNQLFVRTATGRGLDRVAASLGVARPATLGLTDAEFQNLIPNLSLKPKNIRKAFYDTADVFWGERFSRANISSGNFAPFNVSVGDLIKVKIDQRPQQEVKVLTGEIAVNGAATAEEIKFILSKITGTTTEISVDSLTGNEFINLRTNTPGPTGSIEIIDSSMISASKLDFTLGVFDILKLDQRVAVYNLKPNELLIEIPSIVPALRRTLKGSHHFHADSTLEGPKPTLNGIWQGSFMFNPNGSVNTFTVTGQKAALQQLLSKGQVYTSALVDTTGLIVNPSGEIIFGFGLETQEGPVRYRGIPNTSTILLDPSYTFKFNQPIGSPINVISAKTPYVPQRDGADLAIYLTSPSGAREIVQDILRTLAAAGIILNFKVLAPKYKYIIDNPYIDTDDAPSS